MKKLFIVLSIAAAFALSGCAMSKSPVNGIWYKDLKWDSEVVNPGVKAEKKGEACVSTIMGLIATGDASISKAMEKGNITTVSHIDHYSSSILVFYAKYCTVVMGE